MSAVAIDDLGIMDPLSLFAVEKSTVDTSIADPGQHSAPPTSEDSVRESSPMAAESNLRRPQRSWNTVSPPPPPVANESSFSGGSLGQQAIESFPLYSGEYTIISLIEATVQVLSNIDMNCALFMTNYRLVFLPFDQRAEQLYATVAALPGWLQVPLSCIDKLEREKRPRDFGLSMCVHCKDCRQLRVVLKAKSTSNLDYDVERAYNVISAYAFPNNMRHLFAYSHKIQLDPEEQLRQSKEAPSKDLLLEFARIGILESPFWRISQVNSQFKLCGTYPTTLAVPSAITDDELFAIAAFRSGHRLPALCWAHPVNLASLWRSSQPKVGKSGSCGADERMLDIIAKSTQASRMGGSDSSLFIVDCRSRASAMANYAAGAGYESQSNYPNSRLEFFGIPNIHAVRDSLKSLTSVLLSTSTSASSDINFSKQVEDSSWLSNLRLIIRAGWETASALSRGVPVLVHCSHGWDRTAQVCCIAEIMLDPFYRTFEGFPVLIEKEWCSFGHPFQMRCGE